MEIFREKIYLIEPRKAKNILEKTIKFSKKNKLKYAYPWIIESLVWVYIYLADFVNAATIAEEAYKIFEENNDMKGCLAAINALMVTYSSQKNFNLAIECGVRGIEIAQQSNDYEGMTHIKTNMVGIYIDMGDYEKGKEILEQLQNLSYTTRKEIEICNYINRTICETKTNNLDKAKEYIDEAYILAKKYIPTNIPDILKEMANIYIEKCEYEVAKEKLEEGLELAEAYGNYLYITDILLCLSELDLINGEYEEAIEKSERVLYCIDNKNSRRELKRVYNNLNKGFKGLKNYEKAYYYLEKYLELEKEVSSMSSNKSIKKLDTKNEEEEERTYKLLYNQMEIVYSVGQRITTNLDKQNIFNTMAKEIESLIDLDIFQVCVYKEKDNIFQYQLCLENGNKVDMKDTIVKENSFSGYSIRNNKDIVMNDIERESYKYIENFDEYKKIMKNNRNFINEKPPKSAMFVPITLNNKVTGVISTQSFKKSAYTLKDLNNLKILATYIGIALENARLYKKFEYSANYDTLTNIFNRREALKRINELFRKNKTDNICAIMIDADNFKEINDTYGHQVGDKVLVEIASVIKKSIKSKDIVGRYGGEEFIVAFNSENDLYSIKIAEKIRMAIDKIRIKSEAKDDIKVTVSIGMVNNRSDVRTVEQIINLADKALYKAKNTGKNKVVIYN